MIALPGLALGTGRVDVAPPRCAPTRRSSIAGCCRTASPTTAPRPSTTPSTPRCGSSSGARNGRGPGSSRVRARAVSGAEPIIEGSRRARATGSASTPTMGSCERDAGRAAHLDGCEGRRLGRYAAIGKPIEINALWFCALDRRVVRRALRRRSEPYEQAAARVEASFDRYWNEERDCCFDVLDGPHGPDPALRRTNWSSSHSRPSCSGRCVRAPSSTPARASRSRRSVCAPLALRSGLYRPLRRRPARDAASSGHGVAVAARTFVRAHLNVYDEPVAARGYLNDLTDAPDGCRWDARRDLRG